MSCGNPAATADSFPPMFLLKQLAQVLSEPLLLAAVLLALALLSRAFFRCRGCMALVAAAGAIVYLSATPALSEFMLGSLERRYPSLVGAGPVPPVQNIVVLGSSYRQVAGWSITDELDDDGLARVVEGVRLQRSLNIPRIVFTGGAQLPASPPATGNARMARSLGVDAAAITILDRPTNTRAEAIAVAEVLGAQPFILVTSAYHMPRAVHLMRAAGAQPIPAPAGRRVVPGKPWQLDRWLPSSDALGNTERAVHEYLGMLALSAGFE